jgi:hypothetical protein
LFDPSARANFDTVKDISLDEDDYSMENRAYRSMGVSGLPKIKPTKTPKNADSIAYFILRKYDLFQYVWKQR